ncbi:MAG: fructose-6-phosphate aldolase, partial [Acidobacteriota bacterium]|nr:fructose-6-phosphate aldolase [Acidobacteriota bacterium]
MKFFIDTASVTEIREAAALGLLDGVTTNPSLLSKEKGDPVEILREITKVVDGPVSAEVTAVDHDGMIAEAM